MIIRKLLFTMFCLGGFGCSAQESGPLKTMSLVKWQEDIDYFAKRLVKKHGNAFHLTNKEVFDKAINDLKKDLPTLADHQVVVRLLQITASVGDGHTYVHWPTNFSHYPVLFYWLGEDLYAVRSTNEYKQVLGKRLVKIEGHTIIEIKQKMSLILSKSQNEWFTLLNSAALFSTPEILHALSIIPNLNKTSFTFSDENNSEINADLLPLKHNDQSKWISPVTQEPLFRQRFNENFWFSYVEEINAVYVNFKTYDDLSQNATKLFDFVNEKKADKMIIDMRQNGGGDFTKVRRQLIPKIVNNSIINQRDNLFVVTGRRTFSAAVASAIDFKKQTNATIIGEPPGGKPNEYSENDEMTLPNSGLIVSYSTKYYKFLDEDVNAFMPDVRVDPNWKDYSAGIDPVMEKIKAIIRKK